MKIRLVLSPLAALKSTNHPMDYFSLSFTKLHQLLSAVPLSILMRIAYFFDLSYFFSSNYSFRALSRIQTIFPSPYLDRLQYNRKEIFQKVTSLETPQKRILVAFPLDVLCEGIVFPSRNFLLNFYENTISLDTSLLQ